VTEVVAGPKPKAYRIGQTIQRIAGAWPLLVLNCISLEMTHAVKRLASTGNFDVVHLESLHMIRYASLAPGKVVYSWHHIESEAMRLPPDHGFTRAALVRGDYRRQTPDLRAADVGDAFGHVVCSERERCELQPIAPSARIAVVENGPIAPISTAKGKIRAGFHDICSADGQHRERVGRD
jgi:hypothetical protein